MEGNWNDSSRRLAADSMEDWNSEEILEHLRHEYAEEDEAVNEVFGMTVDQLMSAVGNLEPDKSDISRILEEYTRGSEIEVISWTETEESYRQDYDEVDIYHAQMVLGETGEVIFDYEERIYED